MHRPALRWLVLLFTCAWFGVLVPVHNRGQITLGGPRAAATATACCPGEAKARPAVAACHPVKPAAAETPARANAADAPPDDAPAAGDCAVCHFIAALDLPAPVLLDAPPLGAARPPARFGLPEPARLALIHACRERGPPVA